MSRETVRPSSHLQGNWTSRNSKKKAHDYDHEIYHDIPNSGNDNDHPKIVACCLLAARWVRFHVPTELSIAQRHIGGPNAIVQQALKISHAFAIPWRILEVNLVCSSFSGQDLGFVFSPFVLCMCVTSCKKKNGP